MCHSNLTVGKKFPEAVNAFIEIPTGSRNKYEFDKDMGVMVLDRVVHSPVFYPVDYGYIPETHADDGDALDILLVTDSPVVPGCVVEARPIGVLKMSDDKGLDDKILAVPTKHPRYKHVNNLEDVSEHMRNEIAHFFEVYKTLEKKEVKVEGWHGKDEAIRLIKEAHETYKKMQK